MRFPGTARGLQHYLFLASPTGWGLRHRKTHPVREVSPAPAARTEHSGLVDNSHLPVVALVAHDIHCDGGMERACAQLIRGLNGKARFVVVACTLADDLRPLVEQWIPIRAPRRPFPLKFLWFYVAAGGVVSRLEADLVHTAGAIIPNRVDIATVHLCHVAYVRATGNLSPQQAPLLPRMNTAVARALALLAEQWSYRESRLCRFAAVSDDGASELKAHFPGVACVVTPNGVDIKYAPAEGRTRQQIRATRVVGGDVVAIFVGGDWDRKGLDIAIKAVALVRARGVHLTLWVVGVGDTERFAALARHQGVEETAVQFWGQRSDVADLYLGADIFVLPSLYETFSLASFEAAASGLPLVLTSFGGAPSALIGCDEGGRVVEREPASVAEAFLELAGDESLRHKLGSEARRRAAQFTWERSAAAALRLYQSLLAERL